MRPGAVDSRDEVTWIAIELSRAGEQRVEDGTLAQALRSDLDADGLLVFIPAASYERGDRRITVHLMEGYVFVGSGLPETRYFALENKPYVAKVMSVRSGRYRIRTPSVISDKHIEELRHQLRQMIVSGIEIGDDVRVTGGQYQALKGLVLGFDGDYAFVRIELRSLEIIATIPRLFLESSPSLGA